ncbi:FHA domain-containing protein [Kitasatospora sp. NBC_00240]|uniref:FHA domain-containing protein n=1 Tax=Kitasatospora sp. NBC_00240 TaxID=2903567 RepID=UPI00225867F0|nr:FHA domain-containing protein [Kitasatospora sp. NBC_00240]MCX5210433.1 FHA domain-containing protein [Kitasatospora sp. NBC_00240]
MPICPRGHESQAEDWCDFCGFPMTPPPGLPVPGAPAAGHLTPGHPAPGQVPPPGPVAPAPAAPPQAQGFPDVTEGLVVCPICRSPQTGRYCEECGYDYDLSSPSRRQPPAPASGHLAPPPPSAPLNIPAAYGGAQAPQQPAPGGQGGYGYPQAGSGGQGGYGYPQQAPGPYEQAPQQPAQPAHGGQGGYGYPQPAPGGYEQAPQQPAAGGYEQSPYEPQQYERPQPYEKAQQYEQAPFEPAGRPGQAPYEQPDGRRGTGPVYAQQGPTAQGEEFGTSFQLAPPLAGAGPEGTATPEPQRTTWMAVVSADRDYFTDMMARSGPEAAGLFFPPYCPERRIPLTGRGQLRIGRRSQHRGTVPEIDLSVPPEDPGASHQHALLAEQEDGSWVLVDQDSTNGTTVNGGAESIAPHTAVPLNDGDRVHVGAWTTITLHRA